MPDESKEIEVEVVEIDGVTQSARVPEPEPAPREPARSGARSWHYRFNKHYQASSLWWPLWVLLGIIALMLAATVGVALAILYGIFLVLRSIVRLILG